MFMDISYGVSFINYFFVSMEFKVMEILIEGQFEGKRNVFLGLIISLWQRQSVEQN